MIQAPNPSDEDYEEKLEALFIEADTAMIKSKDFNRAVCYLLLIQEYSNSSLRRY